MWHPHSGNPPAPAPDDPSNRVNSRSMRRYFLGNRDSHTLNSTVNDIDVTHGNDLFHHTPNSTSNTQAMTSNISTLNVLHPFNAVSSPRQSSLVSSPAFPLLGTRNYEHQGGERFDYHGCFNVPGAVPTDLPTENFLAGLDSGLYSTQTPLPAYETDNILGPTHIQTQFEPDLDLEAFTSGGQDTSVAPWSVYNGKILRQGDSASGVLNSINQHVRSHPLPDSQHIGNDIFSPSIGTPGLTNNDDTMSGPSSNTWDDHRKSNPDSLSHERAIPGVCNAYTPIDRFNEPLTISNTYGASVAEFDFQGHDNPGHIADSGRAMFFTFNNDQSHEVEALGVLELQNPRLSVQASVPAQCSETLRTPQSTYSEIDQIAGGILRRICNKRGSTEEVTCWSCFGKKDGCTGQSPCVACKRVRAGNRGSIHWKRPCSKAYLESFTEVLIPRKLAQSVHARQIQSYFDENASVLFREMFVVPVYFGFGEEIFLPCQAFQPKSRRRISHRINWSSVSGNRVAREWQEVTSYPFTLSARTPDVINDLENWTDAVLSTQPRSWYQYMLRNNPHVWILQVLEAVGGYTNHFFTLAESLPSQPRSDRDELLKLAMRLCIMTYMISSTIYLSDRTLERLKQTGFGRKCGITDTIAPRMLAMGVKHCLAASIYQSTELCLTRFHNMLRSRNPGDRGHALCVLVFLSITVALNQVALTDCAHIVNTTPGHPSGPIDVSTDINALEDLLATLKEYYHNIFGTRELLKTSPFRHLDKMDMSTRSFFSQILNIYISTGQVTVFRNQGFRDLDPERIAVDNAARLICRVLSPLFPRN